MGKDSNSLELEQRLILTGERFFHNFPMSGKNWRYVSIYEGVLSLFVKLSKSEKENRFVKFRIFGGKKHENMKD